MRMARLGIFVRVDKSLTQEVTKVLHNEGRLLVEEAQRRSPVKTGRLRASIDYVIKIVSDGVALVFGSGATGRDEPPYAAYQEYGTPRIKPKRFIRGAYEYREDALVKALEEAIQKAL